MEVRAQALKRFDMQVSRISARSAKQSTARLLGRRTIRTSVFSSPYRRSSRLLMSQDSERFKDSHGKIVAYQWQPCKESCCAQRVWSINSGDRGCIPQGTQKPLRLLGSADLYAVADSREFPDVAPCPQARECKSSKKVAGLVIRTQARSLLRITGQQVAICGR